MEISLKEEEVTLAVCKWLRSNKWKILYFDFPECGSTKRFPCLNAKGNGKTAWVIPDLLAFKKGNLLICENKSKFSRKDYKKLKQLKQDKVFKDSIIEQERLPKSIRFLFGICLPLSEANKIKSFATIDACDFVASCSTPGVASKNNCKWVKKRFF